MTRSSSEFYRPGQLLPTTLGLLLLFFQIALADSPGYIFQKGSLPILLVSGHGGSEPLPGAAVRQKETSGDPHFTRSKDLVTAELTQLYSDELFRAAGKRPSMIISKVHRKYCDLNRKPEWSSSDQTGRDFHQAFHSEIQSELGRILERHGWALVMDIHGQNSEPYDLIVGTRQGDVIGEWSVETLWASGGLLDGLKRAGFAVSPDSPEQKIRYGGGFIVKAYGKSGLVEAWQLEHGSELRFNKEQNEKFVRVVAQRLAEALASQPKNSAPNRRRCFSSETRISTRY